MAGHVWRRWRVLSIHEQVAWARRLLPSTILVGVAITQVWVNVVHPADERLRWHLSIELVVYAFAGPLVIWYVLRWIERQVAEKEHVERRLREQERRTLQIRDEVCVQIASDLHDRLGPQLYAIALKAEFSRRRLRSDPAQAEQELGAITEALQESIDEVRRAVYALRPIELERCGLLETLRRLAATSEDLNQTRMELRIAGEERSLPAEVECGVFHIVQEALYNVRRHAKARCVRVHVDFSSPAFVVRVRDDGQGFDPAATPEGVGLRHMRERVAALGGTFAVHATPGHGTEILVELAGTGTESGP